MSEAAAAWYYTQHGERKGPVTLEVLRGAIEHLKVDRERDLVWGPGLSDWVTIDKVPELQDLPAGPPPIATPVQTAEPEKKKEAVAKSEASVSPPAAVNPYQSPTANQEEDDNALSEAMEARRGNQYPGMGRLVYWIVPTLITIVLVGIGVAAMGVLAKDSPEMGMPVVVVMLAVIFLVFLMTTFSRLKNLGMSRWNILWSVVPIAHIWLSFRLYVCPAGYHNHRKLDTAGKVLVGLWLLSLVGPIISVALSGAGYYKEAADEAQRIMDEQREAQEEVLIIEEDS
ncbi:DUF4339 domain-containing protein [Rubritalea tangerina]|uniref:GYF domain-containing protein n=1 Tax=Rubritalea tangerina TaxID=430798 RepID=A0ABW4ZC15_9BACT